MAPRPRKRGNKDLPANLYPDRGNYKYIHPITKRIHGMGSDRAQAVKAANILNQRLMAGRDLVSQVIGGCTLIQVLGRFRTEYLSERNHSENYRAQIELRLKRIERELGDIPWYALDLKRLSDWLKPLTRNTYIKYRGIWMEIFKFACSVGLSERNLAELTLVKTPSERKRKRWTLDQYKAVYAIAEPWLQVAMDFAVTSLQRREDLVNVRKKEDFVDGRMLVMQRKTGTRIAIKVGGGLGEVVARAKVLYPCCPFVIGRRPDKSRIGIKKPKAHPFQVNADYLTKAVAKVIDKSNAFDGWADEEKPSLHELRSFGAYLYQEAGYPKKYIQALLGHADAKMTEHYLDGHGKEEWQEVSADLPLNFR